MTKLLEADLEAQLFGENGLATMLGWKHVHWRPAKTKHGWRTPGSGELAKGWPDHTLVRGERLLFVELKSDTGRLSPEQEFVLNALRLTAAEVYVWRPADIETIAEVLK